MFEDGRFRAGYGLRKLCACKGRRISRGRSPFHGGRETTQIVPRFYFDELPADPVVPDGEPALLEFRASNTDIPCGPMVIRTGFPSFDFACTTIDFATTLTSVKPAFFRSCSILLAAYGSDRNLPTAETTVMPADLMSGSVGRRLTPTEEARWPRLQVVSCVALLCFDLQRRVGDHVPKGYA
jgi:hypothetical protein